MPEATVPIDPELALRFGIALGLGLLVGLERERKKVSSASFGGVRTFGLIALIGATSGYLEQALGMAWLPHIAFLAVAVLVAVSYRITAPAGDVGLTSEISALLVFLAGILSIRGHLQLAAALGVVVLLLLAVKERLHDLAGRIDRTDVEATLKFAIISLIVLPLLPDRNFGPPSLEVLNPHTIWWMVVLISGLNFVGYLLVKVLGAEHGLLLTGLLGGLVSSTAVTLGFAQRSRRDPVGASSFAVAILLAWTVMFFRVIVEVFVVNRDLVYHVVAGLAVLGAVGIAISLILWRRNLQRPRATVSSGANPFELGEAIKFGLLFGGVLFVARAAQLWAGDAGLYVAGVLAGLTDVDAIALSMADLARNDPTSSLAAARTILLAVLSNTAVKAGMVLWLGAPTLRRSMTWITVLLTGAGAVAFVLIG